MTGPKPKEYFFEWFSCGFFILLFLTNFNGASSFCVFLVTRFLSRFFWSLDLDPLPQGFGRVLTPDNVQYQASSPDELALVIGAKAQGQWAAEYFLDFCF